MSAAAAFLSSSSPEFAMRTDTIVGLPVSRPALPTAELLIPLKPPVVATYTVRRPFWVRRHPSAHTGLAVGGALGTVLVAAHVIVSALAGSM